MWCLAIICLFGLFLQIGEALTQNSVNMTDMENRLSTLENSLSQEKTMRQDLERKLENTSLSLQQEKSVRMTLENKMEKTIQQLTNTTRQLHDETTSRILLQKDMEQKIASVNNCCNLSQNRTNAKLFDMKSRLTKKLQDNVKNLLQEDKLVKENLEEKLNDTSLTILREKNLRMQLDKKLEDTIALLTNTSHLIHDETTLRIFLQNETEPKISSLTAIMDNHTLALQQEKSLTKNLEKKLEDTIMLLRNTTQQLHDETTSRIILQRDMNQRIMNVNQSFQLTLSETSARFSENVSRLAFRMEDQLQQLEELKENRVMEERNISSKVASLQTHYQLMSLSLLDTRQSLLSLNHSLTYRQTLLSNKMNKFHAALLYMNSSSSGHDEKIMFTATLRDTHTSDYENRIIAYDKMITNYGRGFNSRTGVFTAPKSGDYYFYWKLTTAPEKMCDSYFKQNGNNVLKLIAHAGKYNWATGSEMAFMYLSKGDRVWIETTNCNYLANDSTFSGWKVF